MPLPKDIATEETEQVWQRMHAEGLEDYLLHYLLTFRRYGSDPERPGLTATEALQKLNEDLWAKEKPKKTGRDQWRVCDILLGFGLLRSLDEKRECTVKGTTCAVHYATNATGYADTHKPVPVLADTKCETKDEAKAVIDKINAALIAAGHPPYRFKIGQALCKRDDTRYKNVKEALWQLYSKALPDKAVDLLWAALDIVYKLPPKMLVHVSGCLIKNPALLEPERDFGSSLKWKVVLRFEKFFPGLKADAAKALERARDFDVNHWQTVAAAGEYQLSIINEVREYGRVFTKAERWQNGQPKKYEPRCALERFTGTDEQGLLMARFVNELRNLCDSLAASRCGFTDPPAQPARSRFLEQLAAIIGLYDNGKRWSNLLGVIAVEEDWSAFFDGFINEPLPVPLLEFKKPKCLNPRYPVEGITGTDKEGTFIRKLVHSLRPPGDYFGRQQTRLAESAHSNYSVRQKLVQHFCAVFLVEIKDRFRWQGALCQLAKHEDWSTLLEPIFTPVPNPLAFADVPSVHAPH